MGAEAYVIAPQDWDEQGKRQVNDKHDAQVICRRLSEYLAGHGKALSIVRIPSPEEEARRAQGRMREQLRGQIRRMQAMGRSLLPRYRAVRQWGPLLENRKASAAARKKALVALARRLALDLLRIATGRARAEELSLVQKIRLN